MFAKSQGLTSWDRPHTLRQGREDGAGRWPMTKGWKWLGAIGLGALLGANAAEAAEKTLTWGKPAEITGFDVHVAGTVTSWEMYEMVYETLLTTDENLKLEPGLAASWEQTSPTSYTFKLRPDAKFSNGRAVTAEDIA